MAELAASSPKRSLWEIKRGCEALWSSCIECTRDRTRVPQEGGAIQVLLPLPNKRTPNKGVFFVWVCDNRFELTVRGACPCRSVKPICRWHIGSIGLQNARAFCEWQKRIAFQHLAFALLVHVPHNSVPTTVCSFVHIPVCK